MAWALVLLAAALVPDLQIFRYKMWAVQAGLLFGLAIWAAAGLSGRLPLPFPLRHGGLPSRLSWPWLAWLGFFAYTALRGFFSAETSAARAESLRVGFMVLAAFLAALARPALRRLAWVWCGAMTVAAAYGLMMRTGGIGPILVPKEHRIISTFGNPIFFAAGLVCSLSLLPSLLGARIPKGRAHGVGTAIGGMFLLQTWALLWTETRAAFLAALAAAAALLLFALPLQKNLDAKHLPRRLAVGCFCLFLLILAGAWMLGGPKKIRELLRRPQAHALIWKDTLRMWMSSPVFGIGPGSFHLRFPEFASEKLKQLWPPGRFIVNDAHSEHLQVLAEGGIVGFLLWLAAIAGFLALVRRIQRAGRGDSPLPAEEGEDRRWLAGGFAAAGIGLLVQNLFSVDMRFGVTAILFGFCFGALCSVSSQPPSPKVEGEGGWALRPAPSRLFGLAGLLAAVWIGKTQIWDVARAVHRYKNEPDFFEKRPPNLEETIRRYETLARATPDDARVQFRLGYYWAMKIMEGDGKSGRLNPHAASRARAAFERAVSLDPGVEKGGGWNNLGNVYFQAYNDLGRARAAYRKALEANPDQVDAWVNLGIANFHLGKLGEASAAFREALKRRPNHEAAVSYLKRMRE